LAVCGMLLDKDIPGTLRALDARVDRWYLCDLGGPRGAKAQVLADALQAIGSQAAVELFTDPAAAFNAARAAAGEGDRIVAFGSFLTVAAVMQTLQTPR
jgi:dihydrofolate synthase/folylpolyglutamate synthase